MMSDEAVQKHLITKLSPRTQVGLLRGLLGLFAVVPIVVSFDMKVVLKIDENLYEDLNSEVAQFVLCQMTWEMASELTVPLCRRLTRLVKDRGQDLLTYEILIQTIAHECFDEISHCLLFVELP